MNRTLHRIALSLAIIAGSLLMELLACACVAALVVAYQEGYEHLPARIGGVLVVWAFSVGYRAIFLHLYASWRLKRFMFAKRFEALLAAVADLLLAFAYAGVLSLFFPPAQALFERSVFWIPIFAAILIASFLFAIFWRHRVMALESA
jgi:hypothetical protein